MSALKNIYMREAYDAIRSTTAASPEHVKQLGQRKSDRYNEVLRDEIIDPRDHDFARPEQTAGLNIVNPYSALRGHSRNTAKNINYNIFWIVVNVRIPDYRVR